MARKDDDVSFLLLLLLLGGAALWSGRATVVFTDAAGNPVTIQYADGATDRLADGRCFRYSRASNTWFPIDCSEIP